MLIHGSALNSLEFTAEVMASLGVPSFACTPDQFPALMAAAIARQDIDQWAAANDIVAARAG